MLCDPATRAGAILEIDLGAIVANWRLLAKKVQPAACAAVVKANAYGLGAGPVARALIAAGCRRFFVATLDEGLALRRALGPAPEIAVFNGPLPGTAHEFVAARLIPVLNEPGQIEAWQTLPDPAPAIVHLDTGFNRLGLSSAEFERWHDRLAAAGVTGLISHLACADTPDHAHNAAQHTHFLAARQRLSSLKASLAASSGIFLGRDYHFDEVRPGAALYGINPVPGMPNPMRPVVRAAARILQLRKIDRGESVGYGAAHVMDGPGMLATASIGYADGWLRSLSHRGCGWLAGERVPLLGRVSMDLATFDVTSVPESERYPGNLIELIGPRYGVDDAAADAGTIGYEILTALGVRYHRVYRQAPVESPPIESQRG
ncbi:MAG TPA: alanine racemase [Stellaceae bacterium]|jgi:alanine racemase|nr:alanine racemase [Stellaceae bacterium]